VKLSRALGQPVLAQLSPLLDLIDLRLGGLGLLHLPGRLLIYFTGMQYW
jgi:hypothetical protein